MEDWWPILARYVARYRGMLLGALASSVAVMLTADPTTSIARSSLQFAVWFALVATGLAVVLTATLAIAELRAARPRLPRAIARARRSI